MNCSQSIELFHCQCEFWKHECTFHWCSFLGQTLRERRSVRKSAESHHLCKLKAAAIPALEHVTSKWLLSGLCTLNSPLITVSNIVHYTSSRSKSSPKSCHHSLVHCAVGRKHLRIPTMSKIVRLHSSTSCPRRCRAPGCFVVFCTHVHVTLWWRYVDDGVGWGGVGWGGMSTFHKRKGMGDLVTQSSKLEQRVWQWMWRRTNIWNNSQKLAAMSKLFHVWSIVFGKVKKEPAELDAQLQGDMHADP